MCGICGYINFDDRRSAGADRISQMMESLKHRGPDGHGHYICNNVALGHRRLSIIDIETGDQPMFSDDRQLVIVYNGEIYNYIELRDELKKKGYIFNTESDTEVILNAYREWGMSCVDTFNGVWAFALWDIQNKRLFCSRDRLGEKPFFYTFYDNAFVFGSEIKALFSWGIPRQFRWELLDIYLSLTYIPAPYTFFNNINKLLPGHSLCIENGSCKITKYWDINFPVDSEMRTDENNIIKEFEQLFFDAVRIRMRSDVPYGAFLSGGLDSGSIVAAMAKFSQVPIKTFTIGFRSDDKDERPYARMVAQKFKTEHSELLVDLENTEKFLPEIAQHYDEPFGDPSALPTYIITNAARDHVKMCLSGDGGDEVLCGYTVYQGEKFSALVMLFPGPLRNFFIQPMITGIRHLSRGYFKRVMLRADAVWRTANMDFLGRLADKQPGFNSSARKILITSKGMVYPVRDYMADAITPVKNKSNYTKLDYWLTKISLPDNMLCKVDRASMANSLEVRAPFLDYRLIDLMSKVHINVKMKGFQRKYILRQTIARELPSSLLKRHKQGFSMPLRAWFTDPDASFLLTKTKMSADSGNISLKAINHLLERHRSGSIDVGNALWTLTVLACVVN
jgi:asparagine synthase (glutamine-hydrolysing)